MYKFPTWPLLLGAMALAASGTALAQSHGHGNPGHGGQPPGHAYGHYKNWRDRGRHEGWYKRGGHLPEEYRQARYVVDDWRHAHLREPPHGYHWVRSDNGDFLLVAIATGIITDLLLNP